MANKHQKGACNQKWIQRGKASYRKTMKRRQRLLHGLCLECGRGQIKSSGRCYICLLKRLAREHLGRDSWKNLLARFNGVCHYSGRRLTLGENASIDHRLPSSKWPTLRREPDNLVWADSTINTMKMDRTPREFYRACCEVISYSLATGHLWLDSGVQPMADSQQIASLVKRLAKYLGA